MNDNLNSNELVSALADGRLQGDAFGRAVEVVCTDRAAMATWHAYHVIGDVLRARELGASTPGQDFLDKLSARLAQERPGLAEPVAALGGVAGRRAAANDGVFRWKMAAGVASVAAVAAVGWSVLGTSPSAPIAAQPQLALAPQSVPASAPMTVMARSDSGVMIRDAKLDELLAAHRQFGGASALQLPTGFLRNATFEGPQR
jgi:sigma-E factor negative regulatory protein RseA